MTRDLQAHVRKFMASDSAVSKATAENYPDSEETLMEWLAEAREIRLLVSRTVRRINRILDEKHPQRVEQREWARAFGAFRQVRA